MKRPLKLAPALAVVIFVLAALALVAPLASSREWTVQLDGSGNFTRIQSAINIAKGGDVIKVGPGVYSFGNQGFASDEPVHEHVMLDIPRRPKRDYFKLISEEGPETTILGGAGKGQILIIRGENSDGIADHFQFVEIEGFTFRFGKTVNPRNEGNGGAVNAHATSTRFTNCIFEGNEADANGGALHWGGVSKFVLRDCVFKNNRAEGAGGALLFRDSVTDQSAIINCRFEGNRAAFGGAVVHWNFSTWIDNSVFIDNTSESLGGAIYYGGSQNCAISRTTIVGSEANTGGGIALRTRPTWNGTAVVEKESIVTLEKSIISHTKQGSAVHADASSRLDAVCTLMHGNTGGGWPDTLTGDPGYCDRNTGDLSVCTNSITLPDNNSCGARLGADVGVCVDCSSTPPPSGGGVPAAVKLHPNQPNPFNPGTNIQFELSQAAHVRLSIYDVRGRFVVKLFDDVGAAGMNGPLHWDGTDASGRQVPSGLYTYRIESESEADSRKMLLLK